MEKTGQRATLEDLLQRLPGPNGERSAIAFQHGSLTVKLYALRGADPQQPHLQDEFYVVAQGSGIFLHGSRRERFGPGDVLFAPAGLPQV